MNAVDLHGIGADILECFFILDQEQSALIVAHARIR